MCGMTDSLPDANASPPVWPRSWGRVVSSSSQRLVAIGQKR